MLTKKQFAEAMVREFVMENLDGDMTLLKESHILSSSSLAVGMEYLGLLKDPEFQSYAQGRAGVGFFSSFNPTSKELEVISTRDMLELLPD